MTVAIGQAAPAFSLYDTEKQKLNSGDLKGNNVLVLFFPLAFTSVCTKELCSIRDNISIYNNTDALVLGISVDSLYTLKKFKEEQQLNFTLLSDFNKEASRSFDVLYETFPPFNMQGVSKRAAFLIDKEGIIQYAEVCKSPADLPDLDAIVQVLKNL